MSSTSHYIGLLSGVLFGLSYYFGQQHLAIKDISENVVNAYNDASKKHDIIEEARKTGLKDEALYCKIFNKLYSPSHEVKLQSFNKSMMIQLIDEHTSSFKKHLNSLQYLKKTYPLEERGIVYHNTINNFLRELTMIKTSLESSTSKEPENTIILSSSL